MNKNYYSPIVIIGSGLSGLYLSLKLAEAGIPSLVLTKAPKAIQTNTWKAQGGIAAVSKPGDSIEAHIKDTLNTGNGLCNPDAVKRIIEQAPERIMDLQKWGVRFDDHVGKEGGHSFRRIFHFQDQTGAYIHRTLLDQVLKTPLIKLLNNAFVSKLIKNDSKIITGVEILNHPSHIQIQTKAVVLATGGCGKAFLYTSNWEGATGDGLTLGHQAGAELKNMEFIQFHPTCLYHPMARNTLITEALRGEGAFLINDEKVAFMKNYHQKADLAPRDIVSRSIKLEMKKSGAECVFLDATHLPDELWEHHFTGVFKNCQKFGINPKSEPIPVVPSAHYQCGGVEVDENQRTAISNLFAIGEVSESGLHGANRLASNSLLECVSTGHQAFESLQYLKSTKLEVSLPSKLTPSTETSSEISILWDEVRRCTWNYGGLMRSEKLLLKGLRRLELIKEDIEDTLSSLPHLTSAAQELINIHFVSTTILKAGLLREKSIGTHFRMDDPT